MFRNLVVAARSHLGRMLISVLLGLGAASLFRRSCDGVGCSTLVRPPLKTVEDSVYKFGSNCYVFEAESVPCSQAGAMLRVPA